MKKSKKISQIEKLQVPVDALKIGMYVSELDIPWLESRFALQGFEIKTQNQLDEIRKTCNYVWIEVERENEFSYSDFLDRHRLKPRVNLWQKLKSWLTELFTEKTATSNRGKHQPFSQQWLQQRQPIPRTATFEQEYSNAEMLHIAAERIVKDAMQDIIAGKSIDVKLAKEVVSECVQSILCTPDSMLLLTQLKNRDEYTAQHSMNVCVLAVALGRFLNLSHRELNDLGLSGMLHDIGKVKVPLEILNKPGDLTENEMRIMRMHSVWGHELLKETPGIPKMAIDVALSHHESYDGKGYPAQLSGAKISPYVRMVSIVDMYDAITSNRVYRNARSHLDVLNLLVENRSSRFDPPLVESFVQCIGIYPPGCLVLLSSGEIGVVIEVNQQHRLRPKIILLLDEAKQPCVEKLIDLNQVRYGPGNQPYVIKAVVRSDVYDIDIEQYRKKGIFRLGK